jgi:paraquat-inducible protein B
LASDGSIDLKIFVNTPYDKYVTEATRFWNASGIDVSIGASGVDVRTESLVALIAGGIAFDISSFGGSTTPAAKDTSFTLFRDRATAMKQPEHEATRFVLYFNESARTLRRGAGHASVCRLERSPIGLDFEPNKHSRGRGDRVLPERLIARPAPARRPKAACWREASRSDTVFQRLVQYQGLRAQLRAEPPHRGSLRRARFLSGPPGAHRLEQGPVRSRRRARFRSQAKVSGDPAKLDQLPYEQIGADVTKVLVTLDGTLKDVNVTLGGINSDVTPELKKTLDDMQRVIATADEVLKRGVTGTLDQVNATLEELRRPLATAETVLRNADTTYLGQNAPVQQDLRDALQEITLAARSLRALMDYLERTPSR